MRVVKEMGCLTCGGITVHCETPQRKMRCEICGTIHEEEFFVHP